MSPLRIVSLLPSATELVCALGLRSALVAVSHSCDYPANIEGLPVVTSCDISPEQDQASIDADVNAALQAGRPLYGVDGEQLQRLAPTHIITQGICDVCAVTPNSLQLLPQALPSSAQVVSLAGTTWAGIVRDVQLLAQATERISQAEQLIEAAQTQWNSAAATILEMSSAPKVLALEWLDPPFLGGHWVPEQIAQAGGISLGCDVGMPSPRAEWDSVYAQQPDIVVVMCCGYNLADNVALAQQYREALSQFGCAVWAVDANACFSRPSLRVARGAQVLQQLYQGVDTPKLSLRVL